MWLNFCMVKIVTRYTKYYEYRNAKFIMPWAQYTAELVGCPPSYCMLPTDFPGIFFPLVVYMYVILCMNFYMISVSFYPAERLGSAIGQISPTAAAAQTTAEWANRPGILQ